MTLEIPPPGSAPGSVPGSVLGSTPSHSPDSSFEKAQNHSLSLSRWGALGRDSVSWLSSMLLHTTLLLFLAFVTLDRPASLPRELMLSLGESTLPEDQSSAAAKGKPENESTPHLAEQALEQMPLPQPPMATLQETLPPMMPLPEHLASARVAFDPAMSLVSGGAEVSGAAESLGQQQLPLGLIDGTTEGFQKMIGQLRGQGLDVVLVLDVTGSMGLYLDQAKRRLRQIIDVITGVLGDQGNVLRIARFGIVAYKDYDDDFGPQACRYLKLTSNMTRIQRFLDELHASGGGGPAEPIHRALRLATNTHPMEWHRGRSAVVILVADAPVHDSGREALPKLAKGFAVHFHGRISVIDTGAKVRGYVLEDFKVIAKNGRGSVFPLKDEDAFWRHLIVSVFGRRYEQDVKLILKRYLSEKER